MTTDEALAGLRAAFAADLAARDAATPAESDPLTCRFCGRPRGRYTGSRFTGHVQCVVSEGFKRRLSEAMQDPRLTYAALAGALSVSGQAIRAWFRAARSA